MPLAAPASLLFWATASSSLQSRGLPWRRQANLENPDAQTQKVLAEWVGGRVLRGVWRVEISGLECSLRPPPKVLGSTHTRAPGPQHSQTPGGFRFHYYRSLGLN